MEDLADESREQLALIETDDEKPVILNPEEPAARTQTCEYCGHCPCGCGG